MTDKTKAKSLAKTEGKGSVADKPKPTGLQSAEIVDGTLMLTGDKEAMHALDRAFGSTSTEFQAYALGQLMSLLADDDAKEVTFPLRTALSQIEGIGPRNEAEAMLAVQMVCAHHAACDMTRRAVKTANMEFKQTYGNLANKFSRTYCAQLEGLAKLRRGGKQVVEHLHVNAGGQAVIANTVTTGGGGE